MAEETNRIPNWEKTWHSGLDHVAPGHEVGSHPIERGETTFTGLRPAKLSSNQINIAYAKTYDQEPLPGQWLNFSRTKLTH